MFKTSNEELFKSKEEQLHQHLYGLPERSPSEAPRAAGGSGASGAGDRRSSPASVDRLSQVRSGLPEGAAIGSPPPPPEQDIIQPPSMEQNRAELPASRTIGAGEPSRDIASTGTGTSTFPSFGGGAGGGSIGGM